MGTHGRNAVTILSNGKRRHICYEQTLDGHFASDDLTSPFLDEGIVPEDLRPTVENDTDECEQEEFAHVDYTRKILYTSWSHPQEMLDNIDTITDDIDEDEKLECKNSWTTRLKNLAKIEEAGWTVVFNCFHCPKEYKCVNSIDATIEEFTKRTDFFELASAAAGSQEDILGAITACRSKVILHNPPAYAFVSKFSGAGGVFTIKNKEIVSVISKEADKEQKERIAKAIEEGDEKFITELVKKYLETS